MKGNHYHLWLFPDTGMSQHVMMYRQAHKFTNRTLANRALTFSPQGGMVRKCDYGADCESSDRFPTWHPRYELHAEADTDA